MAAGAFSVTSQWKSLRGEINLILTDNDNIADIARPSKSLAKRVKMTKAYEDFIEYGGPDTLGEISDGAPMDAFQIIEGRTFKVMPRKFAGKIVVTEDALADKEQEKVLNVMKRLKAAGVRTIEVDFANFIANATSSSYLYFGGQPIASASHPVSATNDTFSNKFSTYKAPSLSALQDARTAVAKFPGYHGGREGKQLKKLACVVDLVNEWEVILGSKQDPSSANNAINNMASKSLTLTPVDRWTATTGWFAVTDAENGLVFHDRKPMTYRDWVDNNTGNMHAALSGRHNFSAINPRGTFWSV